MIGIAIVVFGPHAHSTSDTASFCRAHSSCREIDKFARTSSSDETTPFSTMASLAASDPPSGTSPHVDYDEIKRQVERYISEQRAHGPLLLADGVACSRGRPTSLTGRFRRRSLSRRVSRASTPTTARDLRLRAIFDTPGCRTDSSSSLVACHLRRHGATFRRVEEAVVEATERRRRRWARGSVLPSDDDEDDAAAAAADADADDEPDWSDASSCYSRDTDADVDEDGGQGDLPQGTRLGRAPTQVASSPLFSRAAHERTRPSLRRNPSSKSFVRGDDRRFFHASTRLDRAARRPDPTKVHRLDYVVPVTIISESPLDTDTATTQPECDHVTDNDDDDDDDDDEGSLYAKAPARNRTNRHPFLTVSQAEQAKAWRWLATKRIPSVRRVRSVSRRAKTRLVHNNRAAAARARAIGGSLSETVSSRLFERIEVQETIGPADPAAAVLGRESGRESHPDGDRDPATSTAATTADDTRDAGPFAVLRRVFDAARPDSARRATFSGLLPPPRRTGASGRCRSQDHLPTISEASPLRLEAGDAPVPDLDPPCAPVDGPDRCSLTRTVSSLSSRREPFSSADDDDDVRAASSLSGTSSVSALGRDRRRESGRRDTGHRSSTSSSDDLDLTMYQMAISGGTGDYFMAGGEGAAEDDCHDELFDWFLTLGFESEGALVRADPVDEPVDELCHDYDDYDAFTDDGVSTDPGQSPSSSATSSARTSMNTTTTTTTTKPTVDARQRPVSTTKTATDPGADSWQMSCNLTDLGDFLNLEIYHMSALGGGDDVVRHWA